MNIKIGIVIVNWNDSNNTIKAFSSVEQTNFADLKMVVIDNNSSSRDFTNLQKHLDKKIKLIRNNKNYGLPLAVNKGIEYLFKNPRITHILWLNSEGRLAKSFFKELIPFIQKNKELGIIAVKNIYKTEPGKSVPVFGMYLTPSGYTNIVVKAREKVSCPMGTVTIYKRSALVAIKINGEFLASRFFLYAEDLDLGIRILLAGYQWKLAQKAIAYHTGWSFSTGISDKAAYFVHRNILWFTVRCFPTKTLFKNFLIILFVQILTVGYYILAKRKPLLILKAKYDSIRGLKQAWRERKLIQGTIKITDQEFEKILVRRIG